MKLIQHINPLLWRKHNQHSTTSETEQLHRQHLTTYICFAVLRIVLVFIPQLGYVHPDEFFQSTEVLTGEHFQLEHVRTWEFNNTLPLRSITLPFIMLRVPWSLLEFVALYAREFAQIELLGSYTYLVFPRLIMCMISFVNDWSLWRICRLYSLRHEIRLLALGSSMVMLVFGTRTFSNTIEMALCSLLLALVAECMLKTNTIVYKREMLEERYEKAASIGERVKIWKLKTTLPPHNYTHLLLMASICVVGVFNRPTFLLFGAPAVFYWMLRGMGTGTKTITFRHFNMRMLLFCLSAVPALLVFIFCDSLYYQHLTAGELHMLHVSIDNFVFTPWNFVKYNLDPNKTAEHGLHPKYIHLFVNIPLLYNLLGVVAMISFTQLMIRFFRAEYQGLPRAQSIVGLMSGAIFVPLFFLSLINHQEARFLIPVTLPLIVLHAPKLITGYCAAYPFREEHPVLRKLYTMLLCTRASSKYLLKTWYIVNLLLTLFFGFIHQAGVFPLAQHMEHAMQLKSPAEQLHLVTSHIYSLPVSLINIPSAHRRLARNPSGYRRRPKDFYLYEYGSLDMPLLIAKLKLILSHCEHKLRSQQQQQYRLLLAIPASLSNSLADALEQQTKSVPAGLRLSYELQRIFYPHLSTEAFPSIFGRHPCDLHPPDLESDDLRGTCALEQSPKLNFSYFSRQFSSLVHQFGLALYEFKVQHKQLDIELAAAQLTKPTLS